MKRFVFLGDSITDCYHSFDPDNLGEGYVRFALVLPPEKIKKAVQAIQDCGILNHD